MTFNGEMAAALLSCFIGIYLDFSQYAIIGAIVCTSLVMELIPMIHRLVVNE